MNQTHCALRLHWHYNDCDSWGICTHFNNSAILLKAFLWKNSELTSASLCYKRFLAFTLLLWVGIQSHWLANKGAKRTVLIICYDFITESVLPRYFALTPNVYNSGHIHYAWYRVVWGEWRTCYVRATCTGQFCRTPFASIITQ